MGFFNELRRRNVLRVGAAYIVAAWLVIQVVETLFPMYGLSDAAARTVVNILAVGLIPVLVLSWVFEWTPEGFKRDSEAATAESLPDTRKKLDRLIIVGLVVALAYFAVDKFVIEPRREATEQALLSAQLEEAREAGRTEARVESYGDQSIAVLPFADLSEEGDQAYFSEGVAEEILNLLAKIPELRVISRSSAFQFRGDVHIPDVARELNVTYVLEGSVRRAGDQVRVTAQLIDARADAHLWSENFDRRLDNIFEIQDEIARSITDELHVQLARDAPKSQKTDPETYALYLQARHLQLTIQGGDSSEQAESLLLQALERDPAYVPALNLLVIVTYALTGDFGPNKYSQAEGIERMRGYVDRALAIDPDNSEAMAHRGWMAFSYNNDLETAAAYIERALAIDPTNSWPLIVASSICLRIGRFENSIAFAEAALSHDPLNGIGLYTLMLASMRVGDLDKALAASERRMRLAREGGWITRGHIYLLKGDAAKALEYYERQSEGGAYSLSARAIAFHELGDESARDAALAELMEIDERRAALQVAKVQAWMGNTDEAFRWLDRYLDPDSPVYIREFTGILWDPILRSLWNDPRWLELRRQANLGPERFEKVRIRMP